MGSTSLNTRFLGITTTLDDLTMIVSVSGGLYFWLARGKVFGELGLASVLSVYFGYVAVKWNGLLVRNNIVDSEMLAKGYKIILLSLAFDSGFYFYRNRNQFMGSDKKGYTGK